ncbi:LacI family transcriptional regulator [Aureimonas sp. SA4125]|uniref:LacI family DNA-binding transcriptional regulator n=1 Tax=Aureimonas sp. SA4125 TaxID=2826993 RepID=UPI001CC78A3E|nr:LacI family DNA-binding transcriptional regulator [Aureimonas sp. SA4125]BDA86411.1 LacI family transcriptional regulator [Aureimonas sp. SA4125]
MPSIIQKRRSAKPGTSSTLSDVARLAGVSESTVSRVLRQKGFSSLKVRQRVREAVEHLGYVPNRVAGTLASSGSNLVGVVIPSLSNIVFPDLLGGASLALDRAGFQPVIGVSDYDPLREETLVAAMLAWRPAGLIVAGLDHTARTKAMLRGAGVRVAELLDIDGEGIDIVVGFSNLSAGRASAELFLARGYRRIGYVGHYLGLDHRAARRLRGFTEILTHSGLALRASEVIAEPSSIGAGKEALARLLAAAPDLDAVYFSNDDMAVGGLFHCLQQGIEIPSRLAIMGYNGLDIARLAPQPLATILTPRRRVGQLGAELLFAGGPKQVVDLGFELIEGATV